MGKQQRTQISSSLPPANDLQEVLGVLGRLMVDTVLYSDVVRIKVSSSIFTIAWASWFLLISLPKAYAGVDIGALDPSLEGFTAVFMAYVLGASLLTVGIMQLFTCVCAKTMILCNVSPVILMLLWFWVAYLFITATWHSTATPVYVYMFAVQFWISWRSRAIYYDRASIDGDRD